MELILWNGQNKQDCIILYLLKKKEDCMMQKLELYIHIPFCVQKCAYCDFLSAPANDAAKAEYVDALNIILHRIIIRITL